MVNSGELPGAAEERTIEISKLAGGADHNDRITVRGNGRISVSLNNNLGEAATKELRDKPLAEMLFDYLLNVANFREISSSYDSEEWGPPAEEIDGGEEENGSPQADSTGSPQAEFREFLSGVPSRVWERNSLDPIYIIKVVGGGETHEVSFSFSRCPDKLWTTRSAIDKILHSARSAPDGGAIAGVIERL